MTRAYTPRVASMLALMDPSVAVLLALLLGGVVGAGFAWFLIDADARRRRTLAILDPPVPEGIEHLLSAFDAIVLVVDASHNIERASPGASRHGLVQPEGLLHPRIGAIIDACRRSGEPVAELVELPRGRFGNAEVHVHVRIVPINVRFFLVLAEDRTESIRVEHVRRDFVANVSHELKTPIGAVTLLAEAIEEAADDEEQVHYFTGRLSIEAARLKKLTNELIDLSRLQSTDSLTNAGIVDLREILELAVDQARVEADAKRIRLTMRAPEETFVFADPALLLMAFHNLVANAVRYSADASPVGVGVRILGEAVEVAVTDQGIGIAPDDQARIFERFYRVDPARSRRTGGTGLGLSIVKHVIENHGGDVRVWSKLGRGSTFTVRLPRPTAEQFASTAEVDGDEVDL